nr:hypothetical protein [Tanacetum cinerariifolium]
MHNNIMAAGSRDRPSMLATGRYPQWRSRFLRYIDTRPNVIPEHTIVETPMNMSPANKAHFEVEKEAIHLILTGIGDEIYSTVDACQTDQKIWEAIKRLQQGKEIAKPITPPSESASEEDSNPEQAQRDKDMQKNLALIAKANQDNSPRINRGTEYDNQRIGNVVEARETVEQADWRDDIDDEYEDQELETHYMYMAQIQEVTPDAANNSGPIFDPEPLQKVSNNDHYNVFSIESEHLEQSKFVHNTYPIEQDEHNVIIDSLDMSYDREQIEQNDDDDDLTNERELLASLIEKLKCEIDDSKNRNKFLETSNKALVDKLKELDRYNDVNYASKVEIDCAKAKRDLMSYKIKSEESFNAFTQKINDLNQTISEMKKELFAHQETISIMSQQKEAQIKFHKTRKDKELDKVIALENKVKVLDNIVYKTGQSVQTMNMLVPLTMTNLNKTKVIMDLKLKEEHDIDKMLSMEKQLKFLNKTIYKRSQSIQTIHMMAPKVPTYNGRPTFVNPRYLKQAQFKILCLYAFLYDQSTHANRLIPNGEETLALEKESPSKLNKDSVRPYDYTTLNSLYENFKPPT